MSNGVVQSAVWACGRNVDCVRVLVTSSAMTGHFIALVPVIEALRDGGADVLLVVPEAVRERAENMGVPVRIGGTPDPGEVDLLWSRFRVAAPEEASVIANREIFGRLNTAAMLPSVEHAVNEHRPEIILHEATEYAGPITAVRAGIAHAQVAISLAALEYRSLAIAAPALDQHRPILEALRAAPYLTRFPAAVDPSPYPDTRRYGDPVPAARPLPDWWHGSSDPLVYVTFGTVAGSVGTGVYRAAAEALSDLPVRVLMTTGRPLDLGPMPSRIQVRRWVDQQDVLAQASVLVCHGGTGTTLGALAAGVPMVILSMFADQAQNARALASLGVAVLVESGGASAAERATYQPGVPPALRAAVTELLPRDGPRAAAEGIAAELGVRPTPWSVLADLLA